MTLERSSVARAAYPLGAIEFCAWVAQAAPGDRLEYHRGFLGIDTTAAISMLPDPERRRVAALAGAALHAFGADLVHLVQLRLGLDRFAYLAVARPKPKAAAAALSACLLAEREAA